MRMIRMTHLQVEVVPLGLKGRSLLRIPKESGLAIAKAGIGAEEVFVFVKRMMVMMLRPFSEEHLGGTNFSTGPSLMKGIPNGGVHQAIIAMGGPGIGDVGMKKHLILHLSLRVWSQI